MFCSFSIQDCVELISRTGGLLPIAPVVVAVRAIFRHCALHESHTRHNTFCFPHTQSRRGSRLVRLSLSKMGVACTLNTTHILMDKYVGSKFFYSLTILLFPLLQFNFGLFTCQMALISGGCCQGCYQLCEQHCPNDDSTNRIILCNSTHCPV